jgi:plasmid maintenance system killer protein
MRFEVSRQFHKCYDNLPQDVQKRCNPKLEPWETNARHPSLHFKKMSKEQPWWSLRVSRQYRLLGWREGDRVIWDWVGPHDEYM